MLNIYMIKKPKRINTVSVSIALVAALVLYFGYFLLPVYWPVFQLTGIMRGACNNAYRVYDDKKVIETLLKDARRTGLKLTADNFRLVRTPYSDEEMHALAGSDTNAQNLFSKRGKECVLQMRYKDSYDWPLLGKKSTITFEREVRRKLEQVNWEKERGCTCVRAGSIAHEELDGR